MCLPASCLARPDIERDARRLARALGGRRCGAGWMACCPAHDDRTPSLAIRAAHTLLVCCHAGCGQEQVLAALRRLGLWPERRHRRVPPPLARRERGRAPDPSAVAPALWRACRAARGSPVEAWLAARGLGLPPGDALRFHAALKHPAGGRWPAMVALVCDAGGAPVAVHRTFLARDGRAKADVEPARLMLGPCRGGAVRLLPADGL